MWKALVTTRGRFSKKENGGRIFFSGGPDYVFVASLLREMIHEFLVLSPRGDTLILKNYSGTATRSSADIFLRHIKTLRSEGKRHAPPVFVLDGITYCHLQMSSMYFLFTTLRNVQAATLVELLQRLARVFKDYCGVITEESVRRNFLLLYELLDEVFDRGIPQVDFPLLAWSSIF